MGGLRDLAAYPSLRGDRRRRSELDSSVQAYHEGGGVCLHER